MVDLSIAMLVHQRVYTNRTRDQIELGVDGVLGSAVPVNEVDRFHPRYETSRLEKRSCAVGSA